MAGLIALWLVGCHLLESRGSSTFRKALQTRGLVESYESVWADVRIPRRIKDYQLLTRLHEGSKLIWTVKKSPSSLRADTLTSRANTTSGNQPTLYLMKMCLRSAHPADLLKSGHTRCRDASLECKAARIQHVENGAAFCDCADYGSFAVGGHVVTYAILEHVQGLTLESLLFGRFEDPPAIVSDLRSVIDLGLHIFDTFLVSPRGKVWFRHLDMQPSNIVFLSDGALKLVDYDTNKVCTYDKRLSVHLACPICTQPPLCYGCIQKLIMTLLAVLVAPALPTPHTQTFNFHDLVAQPVFSGLRSILRQGFYFSTIFGRSAPACRNFQMRVRNNTLLTDVADSILKHSRKEYHSEPWLLRVVIDILVTGLVDMCPCRLNHQPPAGLCFENSHFISSLRMLQGKRPGQVERQSRSAEDLGIATRTHAQHQNLDEPSCGTDCRSNQLAVALPTEAHTRSHTHAHTRVERAEHERLRAVTIANDSATHADALARFPLVLWPTVEPVFAEIWADFISNDFEVDEVADYRLGNNSQNFVRAMYDLNLLPTWRADQKIHVMGDVLGRGTIRVIWLLVPPNDTKARHDGRLENRVLWQLKSKIRHRYYSTVKERYGVCRDDIICHSPDDQEEVVAITRMLANLHPAEVHMKRPNEYLQPSANSEYTCDRSRMEGTTGFYPYDLFEALSALQIPIDAVLIVGSASLAALHLHGFDTDVCMRGSSCLLRNADVDVLLKKEHRAKILNLMGKPPDHRKGMSLSSGVDVGYYDMRFCAIRDSVLFWDRGRLTTVRTYGDRNHVRLRMVRPEVPYLKMCASQRLQDVRKLQIINRAWALNPNLLSMQLLQNLSHRCNVAVGRCKLIGTWLLNPGDSSPGTR